ncbi:unnamed protein product [Cyprideis torosa]|uniref:Flavoprotein domain-containing protein n=1 Tax=Cyprideis torosa TaxID=163714 RepID=A0A7R8ZQW5_9CRUS|nr:unnamed protein product [Cyprideis torosa]CAG0897378.1 unnamed protein product [Cyprideis torosa]
MSHEIGLEPNDLKGVERWFPVDDFSAAPASGSSGYTDMVVLPCTMGSLGAMATGACRNLIHRAADVMLKERRKLLLAVRETPLSRIHLSNMLTIHDAGAILMPTLPSYYLQPKSLEDAALTYCWRLADQLDIHIEERKRWGGDGGGAA